MTLLRSYNPANLEIVGEKEITTREEINDMVQRAHVAQKSWGKKTLEERQQIILRAYQGLANHKQELAQLIHQEMGKTLVEAEGEVNHYIGGIQQLTSEIVLALSPEERSDGKTQTILYRDPLGVSVTISPWNFPLGMPHTLIIPSLMAGNSLIFKPSEEVFMVGLRYAQILNEVLPANLLQVVIGTGIQGQQLVQSDIQLITFTGSQETGKKILSSASNQLKRVILELGGKDPLIVLEDADLAAAARFAANNSFRNAGQVCVSTEKILVMEPVLEAFLQQLKVETAEMKIGPMVNSQQKAKVKAQIDDALEKGAKMVYTHPTKEQGNYIPPTILTHLTSEMKIMQEETFGPVACVVAVKNEGEAIEIANHGTFGLGGSIFSKNLGHAQSVARQLSSGMVGINRGPHGAKGCPWVGARQSGLGFHGSFEGHRQFSQLRTVSWQLEE